jgi:MFS transporter, ACS family, D-galactonate transporter
MAESSAAGIRASSARYSQRETRRWTIVALLCVDPVAVRKRFIVVGFLIASTEMIGASSSSNEVALLFAVISLSGLGFATGNYWGLTPVIMPGAPAGRLAAVQNMAANLAGIAAPILTGVLKQVTGGYEAPMWVNFGFLLLGVGSYVFLVRRKYAPG